MAFDTLNFALVMFGLVLLAIAVFRANAYQASLPAPPKFQFGFQLPA